jgi:hypothetical protein
MTSSTSVKILSGSLHAAFAIMAIAVFSASAHAAQFLVSALHTSWLTFAPSSFMLAD